MNNPYTQKDMTQAVVNYIHGGPGVEKTLVDAIVDDILAATPSSLPNHDLAQRQFNRRDRMMIYAEHRRAERRAHRAKLRNMTRDQKRAMYAPKIVETSTDGEWTVAQ
jgi:hypothetical protein